MLSASRCANQKDEVLAFRLSISALPLNPWPDIERAIGTATGASFVTESRRDISGGCINDSYVVRGRGDAFFVKLNAPGQAEMFAAEAAGLEEIGRTQTVRVPRPVCHGANRETSWIVLEHLELEPAGAKAMPALGWGLAQLHRVTATRYGWYRDNSIGATPQVNTWDGDWVTFWRERRLGFQLALAQTGGHGSRIADKGPRLMEKLPAFFSGYRPLPCLVHGDLWKGNAAMTSNDQPVIYDPAVYYGDRETDLAMTELFGGFSRSFYDTYRAEYPLDPGYEVRKPLYNLYHVLNHLNLRPPVG
jgi:fructosamine-3-kinase